MADSPEKSKKPPLLPHITGATPEADSNNTSPINPAPQDDPQGSRNPSSNGNGNSAWLECWPPASAASIPDVQFDENDQDVARVGGSSTFSEGYFIGSPPVTQGVCDSELQHLKQQIIQLQEALYVGQAKMAEAEEQLAECYRAQEDERNRHAALEEFWRKTGEEAIADVHTADLEIIKREARLDERHEQLQKLQSDFEQLQTKLADDRDDFEDEKRDQALRRSRIAERELQLQDHEAEVQERARRLTDACTGMEAPPKLVDAIVATEELPHPRASFGALLGIVAAALVVIAATAATAAVSLDVPFRCVATSHQLDENQSAQPNVVVSLALEAETVHSMRWLPTEPMWLETLSSDMCPSEVLLPLEDAVGEECPPCPPCLEVKQAPNQTAMAPHNHFQALAPYKAQIPWRHLKVPAGMLVGLFAHWQIV